MGRPVTLRVVQRRFWRLIVEGLPTGEAGAAAQVPVWSLTDTEVGQALALRGQADALLLARLGEAYARGLARHWELRFAAPRNAIGHPALGTGCTVLDYSWTSRMDPG